METQTSARHNRNKNLITAIDLKNLLIDLKDNRPDIGLRFRLLGEMWWPNFMSIAAIQGKGAMLKDHHDNKLIICADLSNVMQFELDNSFNGYQAHFHYEVRPLQENGRHL
jgi:hypothetical protein